MPRLIVTALALILVAACGRAPEPDRAKVVVPEARTEARVIARVLETVAAEWGTPDPILIRERTLDWFEFRFIFDAYRGPPYRGFAVPFRQALGEPSIHIDEETAQDWWYLSNRTEQPIRVGPGVRSRFPTRVLPDLEFESISRDAERIGHEQRLHPDRAWVVALGRRFPAPRIFSVTRVGFNKARDQAMIGVEDDERSSLHILDHDGQRWSISGSIWGPEKPPPPCYTLRPVESP